MGLTTVQRDCAACDTVACHTRHIIPYVAQLAERRSLAGELTLSYAQPAADG